MSAHGGMDTGISPKVSVVVPTYQHAAFIEKCIDSILAQRTTFPVEILIGEDESSDGTREICERLAEKHPDRIRLFLGARKDVLYIDGQPTGRRNLLNLLNEARGVHIALCEGDDHWVDDHKLQKQVETLEADDTCVGCFTDAWVEGNGPRRIFFDGEHAKRPDGPVRLEEFIRGQSIPVCTMVLRADSLYPLPDQLFRSPGGDTIIFAHLLRNGGHFLYLDEPTALRLEHPGGIFSMRGEMHQLKARLRNTELLGEMFAAKDIEPVFWPRRRDLLLQGWSLSLRTGDRVMAKRCWKGLAPRYRSVGWNLTTTVRNYLKAWHPGLERLLAKATGR